MVKLCKLKLGGLNSMKKKMVKENGDIRIHEACSSQKGISFRLLKMTGGSLIITDRYYTGREKDGNIYHEMCDAFDVYHEALKRWERKRKNILMCIIIFSVILPIFITCVIPARKYEVFTGMMISELGIFFNMKSIIILYIMDKLGVEEFKATRRYHAAEHAVINAYYDLHRVPTLEEIKRYSNWSNRCSSLDSFCAAIPFFIVGTSRIICIGNWFIVVATILIIIMGILIRKQKLCFLEVLVTSNPKDEEYEVAINALQFAINNLENIDYKRPVIEIIYEVIR